MNPILTNLRIVAVTVSRRSTKFVSNHGFGWALASGSFGFAAALLVPSTSLIGAIQRYPLP